MNEQSQAEAISLLSDERNLPVHVPVGIIRTHRAVEFPSGSTAYKIKRGVHYDLAFLLIDLRHNGLERAANITFNSHLQRAGHWDHYASLSLLPRFLKRGPQIFAGARHNWRSSMTFAKIACIDKTDADTLSRVFREVFVQALEFLTDHRDIIDKAASCLQENETMRETALRPRSVRRGARNTEGRNE